VLFFSPTASPCALDSLVNASILRPVLLRRAAAPGAVALHGGTLSPLRRILDSPALSHPVSAALLYFC